ncbi:MAG: TolC family protein [Paucibacter sp.]|nr:TolC family protein [Roseateles sp.]
MSAFCLHRSFLLAVVLALGSTGAQAVGLQCSDDLPPTQGAATPGADSDPRVQLEQLVDRAIRNSRTVGTAYLLKLAADSDYDEARAQHLPTATAGVSYASIGSTSYGVTSKGRQTHGTFSVSMPVFDFGRIDKLIDWRRELREAAQFGKINAEEQIALQTVALALDRSRYTLQAQIYSQYTRRMSCLVDALGIIVKADHGRASELLQAQKSLQEADLSYVQTTAALREVEIQLRHFVGDDLPPAAGMSSVLAQVPDLKQMEDDVMVASDIRAADAQARAQRRYVESVQAGFKPSVSVALGSDKYLGAGAAVDWSAGISVNVPILQPGSTANLTAALRRAQAAELQRDDAIDAKRYRLRQMSDSAVSALDREHRIVEILRNSERVRAFTLEQWRELGRRSLFDVMSAESDYYSMRVAQVNSLFDAEQVVAMMWSQGRGVMAPLR